MTSVDDPVGAYAKFCRYCGTPLKGGSEFCPKCGAPTEDKDVKEP